MAVGVLGHRASASRLVELIQDPEYFVRVAAARSLGMLGATETLPRLREYLGHATPEVRKSAVYAIGWMKHDGAEIPGSCAAEMASALDDPDRQIAQAAAWALEQFAEGEDWPDDETRIGLARAWWEAHRNDPAFR